MIFYFLSETNFDNQYLFPRKIETASMKHNEDTATKRICVALSIRECAESISEYLDLLLEQNVNTLYVHTCETNDFIQPSTNQVFDSHLTGEIWVLSPVKMNLFTILHLEEEKANDGGRFRYHLFDNKNTSFYLYPHYFKLDRFLRK